MSGLKVSGLVKQFGERVVLDGVNITADEGEFVTLLGQSGCGKTTTLRCIAGLESPDDGDITLGERMLFGHQGRVSVLPERRTIGMVFQNYAVWPHMTVNQNVGFPLRMQRVAAEQVKRRVAEVLELVGLEGYGGNRINTLSGGQQQRVGLARALVARPKLLLFDEPLSNLDSRLREQLRDEIGRLQRQYGTTAVYVTHDRSEAMALSDKVYVMNFGQVAQSGPPDEVYDAPDNEFVARFMGFDNFAQGTVIRQAGDGQSEVQVDGTEEVIRGQGAYSVGVRVTAAFRSNVTALSGEDDVTEGRNKFGGTVTGRTDLGDVIEWTVARKSGSETFRVRTSRSRGLNRVHLNVGEDAVVEVNRDDVQLLISAS